MNEIPLTRRDAIPLVIALPMVVAGCRPSTTTSHSSTDPASSMKPSKLNSTCKTDSQRLDVFKECIATYGMDGNSPNSEWPWNVLSKESVAYDCGQIARRSKSINHVHDPSEATLCRSLSAEVAQIIEGCDVGMGSEASDPFRPYYRVAVEGAPAANTVTDPVIRDAFGEAIYPPTRITIEKLEESGEWWQQVVADSDTDPSYLKPWREMIRWFQGNTSLRHPAFVMIGDDPLDPQMLNGGCVFPRMAVALTTAGSLVGIGGWVVHT